MDYSKMADALIEFINLKKSLPIINFDLRQLHDFTDSLAAITPNYIEGTSKAAYIKKLTNVVEQAPEAFQDHVMVELDKIADALGDKINNANTEIDIVRDQVKAIVITFKKEFSKAVVANPFMVKNHHDNGDVDLHIDLDQGSVDWSEISMVSSVGDIVQATHEITNTKNTEPSMKYFIPISQYLERNKKLSGDKIDLLPEYKEALAKELCEGTEVNVEFAEALIDKMLKPRKFKTFINKYIKLIGQPHKKMEQIVEFTNFIRQVEPIVDAINNTNIESIGAVIIDRIHDASNILKDILYCTAYVLVLLRSMIFNNALVFSNKMINNDNYDDFIDDGGTDAQIARYLFVRFPNDKVISEFGIPTELIVESVSQIEKMYNDTREDTKSRVLLKTREYRKRALSIALKEWFKGAKETAEVEKATLFDPIQYMEKAINNLDNGRAIEPLLTEMIFRITAPKSIGYVMYKKLSDKYIDHINALINQVPDETVLSKINGVVVTSIVTDFTKKIF
ncbi:MAG: hypothetical protein GY804_08680 [Alphaproteobacteria bacterium]|nr:hypothetical protein [Alphaproteobacteria bacterium]